MKKKFAAKMTGIFLMGSILVGGVISPHAYAATDEPCTSTLLDTLGITEDEFATMPSETKAFYAGKHVGASVSTTKYFKAVPASSLQSNLTNATVDTGENDSEEIVIVEISEDEYLDAEAMLSRRDMSRSETEDTESKNGSWYAITVTLAEVVYDFGVPIGEFGQYAFGMKATVIGDELDPSGFHTDHDCFFACSVNADCSTIKDSQTCNVTLYPVLGGPAQSAILEPSDTSYGAGYVYAMGAMATKASITMSFGFEPRKKISLIDAHAYLGYWDNALPISPSLTVGPLSISPTFPNRVVQIPSIPLQLRV